MNPSDVEYLVFENRDKMWRFMAEKWVEISLRAVMIKGYFAAALSGGKTPAGFYQHLAIVKDLPWEKTHLFLVDERFVPPFSVDSNYRMLRENFFNKISIAHQNIHPISTVEPSPYIAALKYEEELKIFFKLPPGGIPEFDLILLGIGADGHTASLFPGTEALKDKEHLAVPVTLGASLHDRITLTLQVINNAENVIFLVSGRHKADVMKKLIEEKDRTLPASMVKPEKGRLVFLMDNEARGK